MLKKRSINLAGHATSLALEPEFWAVLEEMAAAQRSSLAGMIGKIDGGRSGNPLASACRLAALEWSRRGKR
jgi:predicted DNA-binding ribbon-helix-helix protein